MEALVSAARRGFLFVAAALALGLATGGVRPAVAGAAEVALPTWQSVYDWPGAHGYFGWGAEVFAPDPGGYGVERGLAGRAGLWTWLTGDREYRPGGVAWRYAAPGTTRIARVQLDLAYADKLFAHHCLEVRLMAGAEVRASSRSCSPPDATSNPEHHVLALSDAAARPMATAIEVRVEMPACNNPAPKPCSKWIPALDPLKNGAFVRVNRADLVLVDDDPPAAEASGALRALDGQHVDGRQAYDVALSGSDAGAGVQRLALEREGSGELLAGDAACDRTARRSWAPRSVLPRPGRACASTPARCPRACRCCARAPRIWPATGVSGRLGACSWTARRRRLPRSSTSMSATRATRST